MFNNLSGREWLTLGREARMRAIAFLNRLVAERYRGVAATAPRPLEAVAAAEFGIWIQVMSAINRETPGGGMVGEAVDIAADTQQELRRREPRHGPQRPPELVALMRQMRAKGRSHQEIANDLNGRKYRTERGRKWNRRSVGQALRSLGIK